ncbi:hypothetical protein ASF53_02120 [Methylobacterium sp. Leaf123]|uniref:hypothetical protein n=1 Tax=Methylobacterium sp. Leaf123 TaxID=1736264 RepID=UPI0006FA9F8A|nr:hypothetical protein [Methylobacterium sp. Leaf123]KQQ31518.1 hypothetical protein ASF53_02120 [Methylobacterium sp. Leaf123]
MSRRRSKRFLSEEDKLSFLAKAGELRTSCVGMQARGPINDPFYASVSKLMEAIDGVAEVVTCRREHFYTMAHSSPPTGHGPSACQATAAEEPASLSALGADGVGRCGGE